LPTRPVDGAVAGNSFLLDDSRHSRKQQSGLPIQNGPQLKTFTSFAIKRGNHFA